MEGGVGVDYQLQNTILTLHNVKRLLKGLCIRVACQLRDAAWGL